MDPVLQFVLAVSGIGLLLTVATVVLTRGQISRRTPQRPQPPVR